MKNMTIGKKKLSSLIPNPDRPTERYTESGLAKLVASILLHGILIPLFLCRIPGNRKQWMVVDGNRRLEAAKRAGIPPNTSIPCVIVDMDENETLITGLVVNQNRESMTRLMEYDVLKDLNDNGMDLEEASLALGKSKSWGCKMMRITKLPPRIQKLVASRKMPVAHGIAIEPYSMDKELFEILIELSLSGRASTSIIKNVAKTYLKKGLGAAKLRKPDTDRLSRNSWIRREPVQKGWRFEIHINQVDDPDKMSKRIQKIITKVCTEYRTKG